jgi:hypothetical protein
VVCCAAVERGAAAGGQANAAVLMSVALVCV